MPANSHYLCIGMELFSRWNGGNECEAESKCCTHEQCFTQENRSADKGQKVRVQVVMHAFIEVLSNCACTTYIHTCNES